MGNADPKTGTSFDDDASGRARAEALLASQQAVAPDSMPYWRAVVAGTEDPVLASRAQVALGFDQWTSDRPTRHANLLNGLRGIWASDDRIVFAGCLCLARSFRGQFRCVEALALLHHARRHAARVDEPRARTAVKFALAEVMIDLEEWERARRLLDDARAEADAGGPSAVRQVHVEYPLLDAIVALELGDPEPAERFTAQFEGAERGPHRDQAIALRSRILEVRGDLQQALARLLEWLAEPPWLWHRAVFARFESIRLRLTLGGDEEAVTAALEFLHDLKRGFRDELGAGRRAELATKIGGLLVQRPRRPGALQLALDLAGAAVLQRVAEVDEFFRNPPGPLELPDDLAVAIRRHRSRVVEDHRALFGAAAELVGDDPDRIRRLDDAFPPSMLRVCAWCGQLADGEDWVPFHEFRPPAGPVQVTHGICPTCDAAMRRRRTG